MLMYLVRAYVDCLAHKEYGVHDSYYAIGLFDSEEKANEAIRKAEAHARETDYEDQYDRKETTIDIIPIEVNKMYEDKEQIYLGGGFYVE